MSGLLAEDGGALLAEAGAALLAEGDDDAASGVGLLAEDGWGLLAEDGGALLPEDYAPPGPGPSLYDGPSLPHALQLWWADQAAVHALLAPDPFGGPVPPLWHLEATGPDDDAPAPPYVVFLLASESDGERTTAWGTVDALLQFNAHAETDLEALTVRRAIRRAILAAPLAVDGVPVRHVLPVGQSIAQGEGFLPGGGDSWVAILEVSIPHETDY